MPGTAYSYYDKDFSQVPVDILSHGLGGGNGVQISDSETLEFLNRPAEIEQMVSEEINDQIIDCKIVTLNGAITVLYFDGVENDYGCLLYTSRCV